MKIDKKIIQNHGLKDDEYKKIVGNSDLFADYGNHFKEMINKSNKIEQELLEILENVTVKSFTE